MQIEKSRIEVGECFECEGFYYMITKGYISHSDAGIWIYYKKSTNLRVQQLEWLLDSTEIKPINDFKNREYIMMDKYVLKQKGYPHKFMTMRKEFTINRTFKLENAVWAVAWLSDEERETNKNVPKYSRKKFK